MRGLFDCFCRQGLSAFALWLAVTPIAATRADPEPSARTHEALAAYVAAPDRSFGWRVRARGEVKGAEYVELIMTSQTWRGEPWRHQLFIVKPDNLDPQNHQGMLFVSGGRWRESYESPPGERSLPSGARVYVKLARAARTPLAILRQVPFQPIFDGLTEDDAIAYTFDRYLETADLSWPLLLPMVKSAVRAMDAVQAFSRDEWALELERFTVTGASKRGWTTWLTGATDPRVDAIAPMVIDILRMQPQMELARASWGAPSEHIEPYTSRDIDTRLETETGRALLEIVDPWSYRAQLTLPKLVILGTNDPYWPLDAASVYWDGLPGEKHILYVPNQDHGIRDYDRLIGGLVALHESVAGGAPLPVIGWQFRERADRVTLTVDSSERPALVRGWAARSRTRDFREAKWIWLDSSKRGAEYRIDVDRLRKNYFALFAEAVYRRNRAVPLYLSTGVRIFPPVSPDHRVNQPEPGSER